MADYNTHSNTEPKQIDLIPAITSSEGVYSGDDVALPNIASKDIDRTFGRPEDFIELHVYNTNNQILHSNYNFRD